MRKKIKVYITLGIFLLISLVDLYAVYKSDNQLETIVKPLIIASLLVFYVVSSEKINKWYIIALLFSFLGDFFMLDSKHLLIGTSCFLVAHLTYIKISLDSLGKTPLVNVLLPLFFFVAFLIFVIWLIEANISSFIVLIVIYGLVICSLAALSYINYLQKNNRANLFLFLGSFLFVVTNIFMGLNRFYSEYTISKVITMGLYILAQFFICKAIIKKTSVPSNLNKETVLIGMFFVTVILGLLGISEKNLQLTHVVTPALFISLIIMYAETAKQVKPLFLLYLVFILIAEVLMLFEGKFINYALFISVVSQLILVFFIFGYKHIRFKSVLTFFITTFVSYVFLYAQVANAEFTFMVVVYGLINAFLTALALDNYISKMYMANYLLWLGVSFGVLNSAIISIDVYGSSLNIYAFITNIITHYLICRSFIIRKEKRNYVTL